MNSKKVVHEVIEVVGKLPTTSLVVISAICLSWATFFAWSIFNKEIPAGWLFFVAGAMGISSAHFIGKRMTQFDPSDSSDNSTPPTAPTVPSAPQVLKG